MIWGVGGAIEYKLCVLTSLQLLSESFLILRTEQNVIITVYVSLSTVPLFLSDFNPLAYTAGCETV